VERIGDVVGPKMNNSAAQESRERTRGKTWMLIRRPVGSANRSSLLPVVAISWGHWAANSRLDWLRPRQSCLGAGSKRYKTHPFVNHGWDGYRGFRLGSSTFSVGNRQGSSEAPADFGVCNLEFLLNFGLWTLCFARTAAPTGNAGQALLSFSAPIYVIRGTTPSPRWIRRWTQPSPGKQKAQALAWAW